jgi:hypothetical protein
MVESSNIESYEYTEIDLYNNRPEKHVKVIKEIGPLNDIDLDKYFTGYSLEVSEDTINCFYGGVVMYSDNEDEFDKEVSEKRKELVRDRLGWITSFEYTPKEVKDITEEFLNEFREVESSLDSFESWRDITNRWVNIVRSEEGVVQRLRREEEYSNDIDYYKNKNSELTQKNSNGGVRVEGG